MGNRTNKKVDLGFFSSLKDETFYLLFIFAKYSSLSQVYVCGQPTKAGFEAALEKVTASYPKDGPIVWVNMRQEPNVYVNGQPMCARPPNKEMSLMMTLIMQQYKQT